jgi:hypothetical protein
MNNISTILFALSLLAAPAYSFDKPVNTEASADTDYKNLINLSKPVVQNDYVKVATPGPTYEELKYYALEDCKNNSNPSEQIIDTLINVEKIFSPPPKMRGMILAAACMESGFRPDAKGDRKFSKSKRKPMAIGVLQQWSYYEKAYGTDRTNPRSAGMSWMTHIVRMIPKVKKQCRYKKDDRVWLAAWVTGIRYKKKGGRCKERPKHYRLLRKWHRQIERDRKLDEECKSHGECGC